MLTITVPNIDYHRPVKRTYPVTVHCPRCKALEDMDAEFIDGKFVRVISSRHFIWHNGHVYCHCMGNGPAKIFLPKIL
jgi:hypothetical protein